MGNISHSSPRECALFFCLLVYKCNLFCDSSVVIISGCSFPFTKCTWSGIAQESEKCFHDLQQGSRPCGNHSEAPHPEMMRGATYRQALVPAHVKCYPVSKYNSNFLFSLLLCMSGKWTVGLLLKRLETPVV